MSAIDPVAAAIDTHRSAYTAYIASRTALWQMHEAFDPEHDLQDGTAIRTALKGQAGPTRVDPTAYLTEDARCRALAIAEDEAWTSVLALVPSARDHVSTWQAYVIEHSAKEPVDEVVNLRAALAHVAELLADRLG